MHKLLTEGNPKTAKGESLGYLTGILHLAPSKLSGKDVCKHSTAGCASACLNTAGRGGVPGRMGENIQAARLRRTEEFFADPEAFMWRLEAEIIALQRKADRLSLRLAIRLNGTSDIPWERIRYSALKLNIFERLAHVQFYDYTKYPWQERSSGIPNYHLTFSYSGHNLEEAKKWLRKGRNVAVVFDTLKGEDLPALWQGYHVIDGDTSDLRFIDVTPSVVGLRAKGKARKDTSGFVVHL